MGVAAELGFQATTGFGAELHSAPLRRPRRRATSQRMSTDSGDPYAADLDLVRRAIAGDGVATDAVLTRLGCVPAMLRSLHRRFGAPLRADELAEVDQNALAALWSKLPGFEGRAMLESWAFRFVQLELHKALDRRRSRARLTLLDGDDLAELSAREEVVPAFDPTILHTAIAKLGPPTSDIVSEHHFGELGFDEIARRRGESVSTIKARYYRGLERLKALLEPHLRTDS